MSVHNPKEAQLILQKILGAQKLDVFWVTSYDQFLSEYTPLIESHRYLYTGFTGSVAELLIDQNSVRLYVDGRYHEQADKECLSWGVTVVKVPYGKSLMSALEEDLIRLGHRRLGFVAERTPAYQIKNLGQVLECVSISEAFVAEQVGHGQHQSYDDKINEVRYLPFELSGEESLNKMLRVVDEKNALFVSNLDTVSWLLNARAYHRPFQSSLKAIVLATKQKALVIADPKTRWHPEWDQLDYIERVAIELHLTQQIHEAVAKFKEEQKIETVSAFQKGISFAYEVMLEELWPGKTKFLEQAPYSLHYRKNEIEIRQFEKSFMAASRAIATSLSDCAQKLERQIPMSELDIRHSVEEAYKTQGAHGLSFSTIVGVGPTGSIIHYSQSSKDRMAKASELVLVDSGAYFDAGLATDTTRTFLSSGVPQDWQKEIYTLVLKGLIQISKAIFPVGTWGASLDALARAPMRNAGFDYAHGTGHGVGINVHEGGYSITPQSQVPMQEGVVGSLEPGIYLPGKGGVRLENIAVVEQVPGRPGMLQFRPLTWVGFDQRLIEFEWLDREELKWLEDYEARCLELGTSFSFQE